MLSNAGEAGWTAVYGSAVQQLQHCQPLPHSLPAAPELRSTQVNMADMVQQCGETPPPPRISEKDRETRWPHCCILLNNTRSHTSTLPSVRVAGSRAQRIADQSTCWGHYDVTRSTPGTGRCCSRPAGDSMCRKCAKNVENHQYCILFLNLL